MGRKSRLRVLESLAGRDPDKFRDYMRDYMRNRYHDTRDRLMQQLGGKCARCGTTKDLQFDHIDASKKKLRMADVHSVSDKRLQAELPNVQLLCRKCHHEKSHEAWDFNAPKPRHGTFNMYKKHGCRCPKCVEAFRKKHREWKRKQAGRRAALEKIARWRRENIDPEHETLRIEQDKTAGLLDDFTRELGRVLSERENETVYSWNQIGTALWLKIEHITEIESTFNVDLSPAVNLYIEGNQPRTSKPVHVSGLYTQIGNDSGPTGDSTITITVHLQPGTRIGDVRDIILRDARQVFRHELQHFIQHVAGNLPYQTLNLGTPKQIVDYYISPHEVDAYITSKVEDAVQKAEQAGVANVQQYIEPTFWFLRRKLEEIGVQPDVARSSIDKIRRTWDWHLRNKYQVEPVVNAARVDALRKLAGWSDIIRGEWWITPDGTSEFADQDVGDQGHEGIAVDNMIDKDALIDNLREYYTNELSSNQIDKEEFDADMARLDNYASDYERGASEVFFGENIPKSVGAATVGSATLWNEINYDVRMAYVKQGAIHVVNSNFSVWELTPHTLKLIQDFLWEQMAEQFEEGQPPDQEVTIEEVKWQGSSLVHSMPLGEFLQIKYPKQFWSAAAAKHSIEKRAGKVHHEVKPEDLADIMNDGWMPEFRGSPEEPEKTAEGFVLVRCPDTDKIHPDTIELRVGDNWRPLRWHVEDEA